MSEIKLELSIPSDSDGFVLLQCPLCGEFFKLTAADIEDDTILEISCPNCGLKAEHYLSDDAIQLAMNMMENSVENIIYDQFKKMERRFSKGSITFSAGKPPKPKPEDPLVARFEVLEKTHYKCCSKDAKINPSTKFEGGYCPFCGGMQDGDK